MEQVKILPEWLKRSEISICQYFLFPKAVQQESLVTLVSSLCAQFAFNNSNWTLSFRQKKWVCYYSVLADVKIIHI